MKDSNSFKFQETTSGDGYFKPYFNQFKDFFPSENFAAFSELQSDEERVALVAKYLPGCREAGSEVDGGKDSQLAQQLKEKGNAEFVKGDTSKALESYSKAIVVTPFKDSSIEVAITLANRSAASYHLEDFNDALQDIDTSLSLGYPKELRYKAFERKAKCLLALRCHDEAVVAFKSTLQALDDSKLTTEKKLKMQNNIQIMLNVLTKPLNKQGKVNTLVEGKKPIAKGPILPQMPGKRNSGYPALSEKVAILEGEDVGRYAAAKTHIPAGETVAIEKAYVSVLIAERTRNHCVHCFKRVRSPYPCSGCSVVVFCSQSCKEAALASYHKYECSIASALYCSGASVTVLMALRMITQKNLQYFLDLKPALKVLAQFNQTFHSSKEALKWETRADPKNSQKIYKSDDYLAVYNLVGHKKQRNPSDFLERTTMAVFLLRFLQKVGYFGQTAEYQDERPLTADEIYIGGLILHHLQILQFNAHEIAELEMDSTESMEKAKSIFIGGGLFPSLALFNHCCDPAVVRYFVGTTVVARTVRAVDEGDCVAENYGPIFTIKERKKRREELKSKYWFDCMCKPCVEDWPLLTQMNRKLIRFRCNANEEQSCLGVLEVPHDTSEFMPKCKLCGQHTNLLKGLKILQETDAMFRQASLDTDRGKFLAALDIYLEILHILYKHLAPPFYDYHVCQEAVRKCMLSLGNKYIKDI